ncbi:MAG: hypothetical protein HQM10_00110 [Candidatus Riflebacteria bacterium]|nr:hypothetical protein [Candidatus Riflebacteria bacterium]
MKINSISSLFVSGLLIASFFIAVLPVSVSAVENKCTSGENSSVSQGPTPEEDEHYTAVYHEVHDAMDILNSNSYTERLYALRQISRAKKHLNALPDKTYNKVSVSELSTLLQKAKTSLLINDVDDAVKNLESIYYKIRMVYWKKNCGKDLY